MRILLVHNRYRSAAPSGENRVVEQEGDALAALGHEVIRFTRESDEISQWSLAKKASLPARTIWNWEAARDLRAALRERRPEVVHLHNTFPLLSGAVIHACRDAGVPVVATIHNYKLACANGAFFRNGAICHECADGLPLRSVRHGCYRDSSAATTPVAIGMTVHRRAWRSLVAAYILISASQRDLLRGFGLPEDRTFVRYNFIPSRELTVRGTPPEDVVVYAGRLDEPKGARLLMAGWDRYLADSGEPGLRLLIAGGGPLEQEMAGWAATRPSVALLGTLSRTECADLIARARAVLLPSTWEETFGLVAVEAMAAGVPPVAAAHGSFTELITAGVDGALFAPSDPDALGRAIADVQRNPEQYLVYGEQGRKTYEQRFDPERSLAELLDIYRFAIAHPVP
ncbi:MAG TPA: glycosyltransferase [Trebonia sp.]|nr:glycosyltransferase [Trebonia sp.]